jgi:hypothetical protein
MVTTDSGSSINVKSKARDAISGFQATLSVV